MEGMADKVLFVDDDRNLLATMERVLRKRFVLDTAPSGFVGLDLLARHGRYAVVVADMGMPNMNGAEFLHACYERFPDTVRIMLTGDPEQEEVLKAVNQSDLFQVLSKPCPADVLIATLEDALRQYSLVVTRQRISAT
jgi:DNA-binding NtrC family response regulator